MNLRLKHRKLDRRKTERLRQNRSLVLVPGLAWIEPYLSPCGVRCTEGVTFTQALVWNSGTYDGDDFRPGGKRPVEVREKAQGRQPEAESTNAPYRVGPLHSSDEAPVMGVERREQPLQLQYGSTRKGRNLTKCNVSRRAYSNGRAVYAETCTHGSVSDLG